MLVKLWINVEKAAEKSSRFVRIRVNVEYANEYTSIQYASIRVYEYASIRVSSIWLRVCEYTSIWLYNYITIQLYNYTRIQLYKYSMEAFLLPGRGALFRESSAIPESNTIPKSVADSLHLYKWMNTSCGRGNPQVDASQK